MARVSGPLFSLSASGTIGKAFTFLTWKGIPVVREWFKPANPKTVLQVNVRTAFTLLNAFWQTLPQVTRDEWDVFASGTGMSGFNQYMGRGMDEYIIQITSAVTPATVNYTGSPPTEVWNWT